MLNKKNVLTKVLIANREAGERLLHLNFDLVVYVVASGYNKDGWCPVWRYPWSKNC